MAQPIDLQALSAQVMTMRDDLTAAAKRLETSETSGTAGGVTVTLTGSGELTAVRIDPAGVQDIRMLERQIVQAHAEAFAGIRRAAEASLSPLRDLLSRGPGA